MTNDRFAELFGEPVRAPDKLLTDFHMDVAASIQAVIEEAVLRMTRSLAKQTGSQEPLPCRRRRAELRRQRQGAARRHVREHLDSASRGRCRRRGRRGARRLSIIFKGQPRKTNGGDGMAGSFLGPSFAQADIERRLAAAGARFTVLDEDAMIEHDRASARRAAGRRLVPGPHGVRPARARRPLDPGRSALARHAEESQSQDQIPRELPAVRAGGAARRRRRLVRAERRQPLHAARRRRARTTAGAR